jgi:2-dehydro-3-deoxyphosphogluconate aldolase/(4S)-4-hydroxy-2-oxoglutarate aldolase
VWKRAGGLGYEGAMNAPSPALEALVARRPVIPVLTLDEPAAALALARALAAGGLDVLEVTLRTARALECIRAIVAEIPGVDVGAGTVLEPWQMEAAAEAGARFLVSPGATARLLDAAATSPAPWLPGAASASEAMRLRERGYTLLKFFPAEPLGGVAALKAIAPVLPDLRFCPTGGIDAAKAPAYLALPNVVAVGGSWAAPAAAVAAGRWDEVTRLAAEAAALRPRA